MGTTTTVNVQADFDILKKFWSGSNWQNFCFAQAEKCLITLKLKFPTFCDSQENCALTIVVIWYDYKKEQYNFITNDIIEIECDNFQQLISFIPHQEFFNIPANFWIVKAYILPFWLGWVHCSISHFPTMGRWHAFDTHLHYFLYNIFSFY